MHIISTKMLREFWEVHPAAESPLRAWIKLVEKAEWETFADVREVYPKADQVGRFTVFDIGGNKFRMIVVVHFDRGKVFIRHMLTHAEYDKGDWKDD
jgi:mRNA interferase HigB